MADFSVYLTSIGNDHYQMFIKNNASEADFIRIIIGYTEMFRGERLGWVADSWIISPLQSSSEAVFIRPVHKQMVHGRRLWVAFEAVKRSKPRDTAVGCFVALSPNGSRWRTTIGSSTDFNIHTVDSIRSLEHENSPSLARMSGTISQS